MRLMVGDLEFSFALAILAVTSEESPPCRVRDVESPE